MFLTQIFLCLGIHTNPLPLSPPSPQTHRQNPLSVTKIFVMLMLPEQITNVYSFQLKLGFSFNLILKRKHLIHFLPFVPYVYKSKLQIR